MTMLTGRETVEEIFSSEVRKVGDLAGVFEYDGTTSYFYLYRNVKDDEKVLDFIHITSRPPDFRAVDVAIRWAEEEYVGLFIREVLWACFSSDGKKFGGGYARHGRPVLPWQVKKAFRVQW